MKTKVFVVTVWQLSYLIASSDYFQSLIARNIWKLLLAILVFWIIQKCMQKQMLMLYSH